MRCSVQMIVKTKDLVMERTLADGSFEDTILTPDNLRPDIPHQDMVSRRCAFNVPLCPVQPLGARRPK